MKSSTQLADRVAISSFSNAVTLISDQPRIITNNLCVIDEYVQKDQLSRTDRLREEPETSGPTTKQGRKNT